MKEKVENGLLGQVAFIIIILSEKVVFSTLEDRGGWGYSDRWGYSDNLCFKF